MHLICQTWTGVPTSDSFRTGELMALQLAEDHHLKRWLIDQQQIRLIKPKDLQWFAQEWLPQAACRLPQGRQVAIVLTDLNQFCKVGCDLCLRAAFATNTGLQSRYFTDRQHAHNWLTAKNKATAGSEVYTLPATLCPVTTKV